MRLFAYVQKVCSMCFVLGVCLYSKREKVVFGFRGEFKRLTKFVLYNSIDEILL